MGKGEYGEFAHHYPLAKADKEGTNTNPGNVDEEGLVSELGAAPMADNQPGNKPVNDSEVKAQTAKHALK